MRYVPGHKGPTLPGPTRNPNDPRLGSPKPKLPIPSQAIDPVRDPRTPVVSTRPPGPAPTGPMTPVRGGGMLPKSLAVMAKPSMKKGGKVKCMAKGGSASKRADGIAAKGKTKGRII